MHVAELWRFPVKSMAGEPLGRADVRPDGIVGDRVAYVLGAHGRIVTARTRPRLLGHRASLGMDGERSEEHTSELQSQSNLVCRLLLEKKKNGVQATTISD